MVVMGIWWYFKNDDDPKPPEHFWKDKPEWLRQFLWFIRNPMHNLMFYGIGCKDAVKEVKSTFPPYMVFNPDGGYLKLTVVCNDGKEFPFWSYRGDEWEWYFGWRPVGAFGIALRKRSDKQ